LIVVERRQDKLSSRCLQGILSTIAETEKNIPATTQLFSRENLNQQLADTGFSGVDLVLDDSLGPNSYSALIVVSSGTAKELTNGTVIPVNGHVEEPPVLLVSSASLNSLICLLEPLLIFTSCIATSPII
jgi:hypothetical protein